MLQLIFALAAAGVVVLIMVLVRARQHKTIYNPRWSNRTSTIYRAEVRRGTDPEAASKIAHAEVGDA